MNWFFKKTKDEPTPSPHDTEAPQQADKPKEGWLTRLKSGLGKSSTQLTDGISGIFTKRKLDEQALEALEELLITADLGPHVAAKITAEFGRTRFGKDIDDLEVRQALASQIAQILAPYAQPLIIDRNRKPFVMLVIGVNGVGKTTTIGKLAQLYAGQGLKIMLAAGDTFRAAAVSQLQIWGERTGCPVVTGPEGSDAASLAYTALTRARDESIDLLLIDTAGRLHNKSDLMDELNKIVRVLKKLDPEAPHAGLLVVDATTGQNALTQVETFRRMAPITGLIVTKLDGSAKGGMIISLAEKTKLPIHAIGVGESVADLRPFAAEDFARALLDIGSSANAEP